MNLYSVDISLFFTTFEYLQYHRGQIYVIGRHSEEQSEAGDGIETVLNEPCEDPLKGKGRKTVKKIHLNK